MASWFLCVIARVGGGSPESPGVEGRGARVERPAAREAASSGSPGDGVIWVDVSPCGRSVAGGPRAPFMASRPRSPPQCQRRSRSATFRRFGCPKVWLSCLCLVPPEGEKGESGSPVWLWFPGFPARRLRVRRPGPWNEDGAHEPSLREPPGDRGDWAIPERESPSLATTCPAAAGRTRRSRPVPASTRASTAAGRWSSVPAVIGASGIAPRPAPRPDVGRSARRLPAATSAPSGGAGATPCASGGSASVERSKPGSSGP